VGRPPGRTPQGVPQQGESRLSRYRAERLLRKDFAGLRAKVLTIVRGQLRAKGIALDPADLEACYAQAWHGLYARVLEGKSIENPSAWLVLVTFRRAIDEHRAAGRAGVVGLEEIGSYRSSSDAARTDLASELDDRMRLREVFEALRSRLSARECEAASLCYLQGLSRAEAAERMGVSEARMRKLMEGAGSGRAGVAGKVGELLDTIKAGAWCEQQSSLMRAYAFGILEPGGERHALAVAHCRECPACRAHVASLRGLASVLPLPLVSPVALAGAPGGGGSASGRAATRGGMRAAARRAAMRGWAPVRRLAGNPPRGGGGYVAGGGANASRLGAGVWSAVAGSLTAKLAVTAIVVVGVGYVALGSHAHASPSGGLSQGSHAHASPSGGGPSHAAPSLIAVTALSQAPFVLPAMPLLSRPPHAGQLESARGTRSKQIPTAATRLHSRAGLVRDAASDIEAGAAREFGPERTFGRAPTQSTAQRTSSPPGEFGFE
jgi:RNA polymerase sigma factor (sigma-70 family)